MLNMKKLQVSFTSQPLSLTNKITEAVKEVKNMKKFDILQGCFTLSLECLTSVCQFFNKSFAFKCLALSKSPNIEFLRNLFIL